MSTGSEELTRREIIDALRSGQLAPSTQPERDRRLLIDYLQLKVRQEGWHGVSDAANDLREMDAAHHLEGKRNG